MSTTETDGGGSYGGSPFDQMDSETARHPQPSYKLMRDLMPVTRMDGIGVLLAKRADIDEAFRQPELFSSAMDAVDLQNVRPLIPLQIGQRSSTTRRDLRDLRGEQRPGLPHQPGRRRPRGRGGRDLPEDRDPRR